MDHELAGRQVGRSNRQNHIRLAFGFDKTGRCRCIGNDRMKIGDIPDGNSRQDVFRIHQAKGNRRTAAAGKRFDQFNDPVGHNEVSRDELIQRDVAGRPALFVEVVLK